MTDATFILFSVFYCLFSEINQKIHLDAYYHTPGTILQRAFEHNLNLLTARVFMSLSRNVRNG